jgi:uncharacterized protein
MVLTFVALVVGCSNGEASSSQSTNNPKDSALDQVAALPLAGRVTDAANILSREEESALTAKLQKLETATHHQMVVVTVPALGGRDIADYARELGNSWGIGRKGHDDGVLLVVAPHEHKVRIAVGYGLENRLTQELCDQIIRTEILPRFRRGDLPGGIEAGTEALIDRLS